MSYETTTYYEYYWLYEFKGGTGYKTRSDKPINFHLTIPSNWWEFWNYSAGVNATINGYGFGAQFGGNINIKLILDKNSYSLSADLIGRISFKSTYSIGNGFYNFNTFSLNIPEIGITVAGIGALITSSPITAPAAAITAAIMLLINIR